jgi:hypothetical protein
MPCNDVTEFIEVALDSGDRLKSYALSKTTCGRPVGPASLLIPQLGGRSVDELLAYDAQTFLTAPGRGYGDLEEFLSLKHLFAIQATLKVLTGGGSGGPKDSCAVALVTCENGDVVIRARILVDLITDKIKSCRHCAHCGRKKEKAAS